MSYYEEKQKANLLINNMIDKLQSILIVQGVLITTLQDQLIKIQRGTKKCQE